MDFILGKDAKNAISQIVLNDKSPNPKGTTQGAAIRMVTIVTAVMSPFWDIITLQHFRVLCLPE